MTGLVMMGLQAGVVLCGFLGASKVFEWYHRDTASKSSRGSSRSSNSYKRSRNEEDDFFF